ncbi:hypothetical protein K3495_g3415 [Podosphaera aphanis]|nr:hypothetical protein K3495_g3415 [Podosphaera aphanis]
MIDLTEVGGDIVLGNGKMIMATTKVVFNRGAGGVDDFFEPGTLRERAYLRSIAPGNLATANVNIFVDEDDIDEEDKFVWGRYNKKKQY